MYRTERIVQVESCQLCMHAHDVVSKTLLSVSGPRASHGEMMQRARKHVCLCVCARGRACVCVCVSSTRGDSPRPSVYRSRAHLAEETPRTRRNATPPIVAPIALPVSGVGSQVVLSCDERPISLLLFDLSVRRNEKC